MAVLGIPWVPTDTDQSLPFPPVPRRSSQLRGAAAEVAVGAALHALAVGVQVRELVALLEQKSRGTGGGGKVWGECGVWGSGGYFTRLVALLEQKTSHILAEMQRVGDLEVQSNILEPVLGSGRSLLEIIYIKQKKNDKCRMGEGNLVPEE